MIALSRRSRTLDRQLYGRPSVSGTRFAMFEHGGAEYFGIKFRFLGVLIGPRVVNI